MSIKIDVWPFSTKVEELELGLMPVSEFSSRNNVCNLADANVRFLAGLRISTSQFEECLKSKKEGMACAMPPCTGTGLKDSVFQLFQRTNLDLDGSGLGRKPLFHAGKGVLAKAFGLGGYLLGDYFQ